MQADMNLDDLDHFKKLDKSNMITEIDGLPDQLQNAWDLGRAQPLPELKDIRSIVIAGMGASAIGADLVAAAVFSSLQIPIIVHRDYGLPAFAKRKDVLVICSSYSGNTEETLDSFDTALKNQCGMVAIPTRRGVSKRASPRKSPLWSFE